MGEVSKEKMWLLQEFPEKLRGQRGTKRRRGLPSKYQGNVTPETVSRFPEGLQPKGRNLLAKGVLASV